MRKRLMGYRALSVLPLFVIFMVSTYELAFAQSIGRSCDGTQFPGCTVLDKYGNPIHNQFLKSGQTGYVICSGVKYECTGCGSCTPVSSSSSPTRGLGTSQQMQLQMFQSFMQPFFDAFGASIRQSMLDLIMPSSPAQDTLRQQQEEMKRKQEEEARRQAYEQWMNELKKAELERLAEEQRKKEEGEKILAMARIGGEGLQYEPIGGILQPFSWDRPDAKLSPEPATQYPAPKSAIEQMMCAAYFSELANDAVKIGDMEGAHFYGDQMSNVMQGAPTAIKCSPPKNLISNVDLNKAKELNRKYAEMSKLYQEFMPKIEKLSDVEVKLNEVKMKKENAEQKIKELNKQIEEIKARSKPTDSPEKKAKDDDLLAQALALKSEAEKQYNEAVQSEEKLLKEKEQIEDELNSIKNKIQKGDQK